jgi:glycosyltransferase involved in cell wall biosynthesis
MINSEVKIIKLMNNSLPSILSFIITVCLYDRNTIIVPQMKTLLIAVTSYNTLSTRGEEALRRAIDSMLKAKSALQQHVKNITLIISWVDDGSTDQTASWINTYTQGVSDFHLFVLHNNMGTSFARNLAAGQIDSDYIVLFDSDDEMLENHLLTCFELMEYRDRLGFFAGIGSTQLELSQPVLPSISLSRLAWIAAGTKVIRRSVWNFLEGMPSRHIFRFGNEDTFFAKVAQHFFPFYASRKATMRYWQYAGNTLDNIAKKDAVYGNKEFTTLSLRQQSEQAHISYLEEKYKIPYWTSQLKEIATVWQGQYYEEVILPKTKAGDIQ